MCSNPCFWSWAVLETVIKLATISVVFIPDSMINYPPLKTQDFSHFGTVYCQAGDTGKGDCAQCWTFDTVRFLNGGCNLESVRTWIWQTTAKLLALAPSAVSKGAPCWCGSKKIGQTHKSIQLIKHIDMLKLPSGVLLYSFVHLLSSDWPPLAFTHPAYYSPLVFHWPSLHLTHFLSKYNSIYIFYFFHSRKWSKTIFPKERGNLL